jgi:CDGSH-type Zn-finger protein
MGEAADHLARTAAAFAQAAGSSTTPAQPALQPTGAIDPAAVGAVAASPAAETVEAVEGRDMVLLYEGQRCIHSRFCVTGAPKTFLANVQGPWLHPDETAVDRLVEIAHACPSGAIKYRRKDGKPDEVPPLVNLAGIRENGPYAIRAEVYIDDEPAGYRLTLCRCGASKSKPFCDGSHAKIGFTASGEPHTGSAEMLAVRDGRLNVRPQTNGPLAVDGPLEIISGTGRVVARVTRARLCRCGGSGNKPFCDGTHAKIGFKST